MCVGRGELLKWTEKCGQASGDDRIEGRGWLSKQECIFTGQTKNKKTTNKKNNNKIKQQKEEKKNVKTKKSEFLYTILRVALN